MSANSRIRFGLHIVFVCCTLHHLIIIIVRTYLKTLNLKNACQIYLVECVSEIKHIISVIHYTTDGAVCFQFAHFLCDDLDNTYFVFLLSSNREYELFPLFRVRSWHNGMHYMYLNILILIVALMCSNMWKGAMFNMHTVVSIQ